MRALELPPLNQKSVASSFKEKLDFARTRVSQLEQFRIHSALSNNPVEFQQVFSLLPLLFHTNITTLPGYVAGVPQGIFAFEIYDYQREFIAQYLADMPDVSTSSPFFDGIYVMGSTASITQTCFSDLDVWLCHSAPLAPAVHSLMKQKMQLIQEWAGKLGVEISLFLMNPNEFKAQQYRDDTHDEHNGSAQHFFLLDEFYRSAIRLAGKRILWPHIDTQGQSYPELIKQAVKNGELNANEWIDFGDFSSLSINEFFGASLWQLYKGIKSPHKSLIKILLLESYADTYPKKALISKQFKRLLLSEQGVNYHFDPYLAMLEQVTVYLSERHEFQRLNCIRRCFYLKAHWGQSNAERQNDLLQLARLWQWDEEEIAHLNRRESWKVKAVSAHHQMLVTQLLYSYRHFLLFARKFQLDPSIMPQDTDFLMRQLYSAFEQIPGKIRLINESKRYNLAEEDLTFIEVAEGSAVNAGWHMVNHAPLSPYESNRRYVMHDKSLIKLIAWGYFNGLITANTTIHLVSPRLQLVKLRQFITDLRLSFPARAPTPKREDFYHPHEVRNLIVAINLLKDPTQKWSSTLKTDIERVDPFHLSGTGEEIIGSISIIYRNMWNEILTQHFEGANSLLKALKLISNKIYRHSAPPQSVNVYCYSRHLCTELQQFTLNLVERCISVKTGSAVQAQASQVVQMAGQKWHLVFNRQQELKEIVPETMPAHQALRPVPQAIYAFASEGFLQFFFDDNPDGSFNVYVLDKQNKIESYHYCQGAKEDKIREISRLYRENCQEERLEWESFNFPQFYQLLWNNECASIVPFQSKQHRDFLEKQPIKEERCQQ